MSGNINGQARREIDISFDALGRIILLARAYEAGKEAEAEQENAPDSPSRGARHPGQRALRDLRDAIDALSDDEQALLVALSLPVAASLHLWNLTRP